MWADNNYPHRETDRVSPLQYFFCTLHIYPPPKNFLKIESFGRGGGKSAKNTLGGCPLTILPMPEILV